MTIMRAPGTYQNFEAKSGNTYHSDANGIISQGYTPQGGSISGVAQGDIADLVNMGCTFSSVKSRSLYLGVVLAASLTVTVANVAVANGALTIAAQPDVARQLVATLAPGAADVTAGTLTMVYIAADGSQVTDVLSLVTASGVTKTVTTSKAVARLTSATVAGFVGGSSPTIEVGTNTKVGLPAEQGAVGFSVYKETSDHVDAGGTFVVDAVNGLYTLQTTPNGTHVLNLWYNYY